MNVVFILDDFFIIIIIFYYYYFFIHFQWAQVWVHKMYL